MKATVVLFVLSVINCTIYGAPAKAKNGDITNNAIEKLDWSVQETIVDFQLVLSYL